MQNRFLANLSSMHLFFTIYLGVPKKSSFAKQVSSNNIQLQDK